MGDLFFTTTGADAPGAQHENNSDHPHPAYLQKICPQNMPYTGGLYGIKVGSNQGISTENTAYGPQKYGTRTPPFYAIWTVFIGGGGGLQFADSTGKNQYW